MHHAKALKITYARDGYLPWNTNHFEENYELRALVAYPIRKRNLRLCLRSKMFNLCEVAKNCDH